MVQDPQAREKGMITQKTKHIYETHLQEALKRRAQDPSSKTKDTCRLVHKMANGFLTLSHRVRVRREEEREE